MKIAIWYDTPAGEDRVVEYVANLGIRHVICDARHVAAANKEGEISPARLKALVRTLGKADVEIAAITVGWVRAQQLDPVAGKADRRRILKNIRTLGQAGVPVAQLFVMVKTAPDEAGRDEQWRRLIEFGKEAAQAARQAGVRVGVHGSQVRQAGEHMLTDLPSYQKLFAGVKSPALGATLCLGCLTICGSDAVRSVRELGRRIVFLHARDVILHEDGSWTDVNLGNGQIDYPGLREALREVKFAGPVQPEHLGHVSFEPGESVTMARAVGFLRGLLQPGPTVKPKRRR